MRELKNIGESQIRKMQRKRNSKRQIDLEFCTVAILIFIGMTILVANW